MNDVKKCALVEETPISEAGIACVVPCIKCRSYSLVFYAQHTHAV